jgi:hypothetical protein
VYRRVRFDGGDRGVERTKSARPSIDAIDPQQTSPTFAWQCSIAMR